MDTPIDSALVHRFSCFQALNADQIAAFAAHLKEVRLPAGKILFRQGDPGDSFYLLLSGQILIKLGAPAQDDRTLATLGPGAILGELGPFARGVVRTRSKAISPEFGSDDRIISCEYSQRH
jgi:CRP-like cAMP-binding protein